MASIHATVAAIKGPAAGIQRLPIQSSFIASFDYDAQNLTLTTHLKSNAIYQHKFVTPLDWEALKSAKSPSKYWASAIKGKKQSVKVLSAKAPRADVKRHA